MAELFNEMKFFVIFFGFVPTGNFDFPLHQNPQRHKNPCFTFSETQ
jgi:hypothetical protein